VTQHGVHEVRDDLQCSFLAGMVFTIALAEHEPWDDHVPHEPPEQVVVHAAPITSLTSGSFLCMFSMAVTSGFPSPVFGM